MIYFSLISLSSFVSLTSVARAALFAEDGAVQTLTSTNFDETIAKGPSVAYLAMTATWCGHCKNLSPELAKAAEALTPLVAVYNVDCDADRDICARFDVKSYPTLKIYTRGTKLAPRDYTGERVADAMTTYALESIKNVVKRMTSLSELETWQKKGERVLLLSPKPLTPPFYKVIGLDFQPMELGAIRLSSKTEDVREKFGVVGQDPVIVYLKEGQSKVYQGEMAYEQVKKWIEGVRKGRDEL